MLGKFRRFAARFGARLFALLLAVLLTACLAVIPAAATGDGTDDPVISFPDPPRPPTPTPTPEPTPVPTPVPTPEPTPVPTPEPTLEPPLGPTQAPPAPTDPPYVPPQPSGNTGNHGGTTTHSTPRPTFKPTQTPVPSESPQPTSQPADDTRPTIDRPKVELHTSPSPASQDGDGHNYVTFAKLNQKNNSLSIALFYGGLACVVLGVGGGAALLVSWLRQRSRDSREAILLKVEQAESRQRPISRQPQLWEEPAADFPAQPGPQPRQRPAPRPSAERLGEGHPEGDRPAGIQETLRRVPPSPQAPVPVRSTASKPLMPVAASYYTEEFSISEGPRPAAPETVSRAVPQRADASLDSAHGEAPKPVRTASSLQAYRHQKPDPDAPPPPKIRRNSGEKAQQPSTEQAASQQTAPKQAAQAPVPAAGPAKPPEKAPEKAPQKQRAEASRGEAKPPQEKARAKKPPEPPDDDQLPGQISFLE